MRACFAGNFSVHAPAAAGKLDLGHRALKRRVAMP